MNVITSIAVQKNNKERVSIFVDDQFFCGANYMAVVQNGLKVGKEINVELVEKMLLESDRKDAYIKGLNYVLKSLKTKKQVADYLKKKGYVEEVSSHAIELLIESKYIDDLEYAKVYCSISRLKGKNLIKYELYQKGVGREIAEEALSEYSEENNLSSLKELANKYVRGKVIDMKFKQKTIMYLRNKGYDFDDIKTVVEEIINDK